MPDYKYKAINSAGKSVVGMHTANTKEDVVAMLRSNKYYPVTITEHIQSKDIHFFDIFNKVKLKDISIFCRQFHAMINAGVSIINCLDILRQQIENKKLRKVTNEVYDLVQKGLTLSEAMNKHNDIFPDLLIHMVSAGEASGNLDTIMDRLAIHFEKENNISSKVKSAMIYPALLSTIAVIVVTLLLIFIFPTFVDLFQQVGAELPGPTKIVLGISNALTKYWYIAIAIVISISYMLPRFLKTEAGKMFYDSMKFKLPIVKGTVSKVVTSRFSRTLSTLLTSGMSLLQALELVSKVVDNKLVERGILIARDEVRKGISLAVPIKKIGVFPPMLVSMISIGEESGSLDDILERTANFYDSEVESSIEAMTKALEPLLLVVMSVLIGFIVIAMIMPMFDILNKIQY